MRALGAGWALFWSAAWSCVVREKRGDVWTEGEELRPSKDTRWSKWVVRGHLLERLGTGETYMVRH